ncbi:hypothetical protein HDU89_000295 [Geranomyces variabilis]|nr:hypothetical protein HDU89_000295 [Geranomyces variabilis]
MPSRPKGAGGGYFPLTAYSPRSARSSFDSTTSSLNAAALLATHSPPPSSQYLARPAPDPYADPYAEPPDQSDDGETGSANNAGDADSDRRHPNPLLERLISDASLHDQTGLEEIRVDCEERDWNDVPFAVLYALGMASLLLTGVIMLLTTTPGPAETILPRSVYRTIKDSAGLLAITTAGAVGVCCVWLSLLRAYVRPVVLFTIYTIPITCLGFFATMVALSAIGKANDAPYLGAQYDGALVSAAGFLMAGVASATYLYRRRKETEQTVHILQLSCDILRTNPGIFVVSIALTTAYTVFALTWVLLFSRLFLRGWKETDPTGIVHWHLAGGTGWAVAFFTLMYFWTSAIFKNVEKVTIAGVVSEWYFQRMEGSTTADRTWKNFRAATSTQFGSVCLGSLILGVVQTLQFFSRLARRVTGGGAMHRLFTACLDCGGHLADNVTSYALVYVGLTGVSFASASYATTRVFRRNLVLGLVTATVTRLILFVATTTLAGGAGIAAFFFASRGLQSPYAYVVGVVGAVVPYYLVQVLAHVVQNTVDATFICYLLDVDANAVNCESAHRIFSRLTR